MAWVGYIRWYILTSTQTPEIDWLNHLRSKRNGVHLISAVSESWEKNGLSRISGRLKQRKSSLRPIFAFPTLPDGQNTSFANSPAMISVAFAILGETLDLVLANIGPWAKSSPPPSTVNTILLKHSHSHLFTCCLWLLSYYRVVQRQSWGAETEAIWHTK